MPVSNFRDFGGYASRHGGHVITDRLYRSALIHKAPDDARARLAAYDFGLIVDLRYKAEQDHEPSEWPAPYETRVLLHGSDREGEAPHLAILGSKATDPGIVDVYFTKYYNALPYNKLYRPLFAEVLKRLAELDGRMLVHCTAGKDRTGMIVAIIHSILGVSFDEIMADFMLSAHVPGLAEMAEAYVETASRQYGYAVPPALLQKLMRVEEDYLHAAFRAIEAQSGSMDAYLDEMGVDAAMRARLQDRLLVNS